MKNQISHNKGEHDELRNSVRRLQERGTEALAWMGGGDLDPASPMSPFNVGAGGGAGMDDVWVQVNDLHDRITSLASDLREVQTDGKIAPKVKALVGMLQELSPKVISQEASLTELQGKVEQKANEAALQDIGAKLAQLSESSERDVNTVSDKQNKMEKHFQIFDDRLGRLEAISQTVDQIRKELDVLNALNTETVVSEDGVDLDALHSQRTAGATE